ncbi:hypothetical protein B0H14DRAFT_2751073 [Mycena olivaceomarginata]|nr:hypothetical protein B0H14DRAFT_2751073 [Mycena olivaceomarginata]
MSDPVAANADLLKTTVSPAALAGIAKWYGKAGDVATAEIVSIDSKSMTLNCKFVGVAHRNVVVAFKPRLTSYADAEETLLEMKAISQEGLGKAKPPKIRSFRLQPTGIPDGIFIFTLFPYLMFSPPHGGSRFFAPAQLAQSYVDVKHIGWAFGAGHSIPFGATVAYTGLSMFTGFHTWVDLKKRIRIARIDAARKSA